MSDLIKRGDARSDIICLRTYQHRCRDEWLTLVSKRDVINAINSIPSADRPRGEWMAKNSHTMYCSVCGFEEEAWRTQDYGYCPNCGAKMKGADDEND